MRSLPLLARFTILSMGLIAALAAGLAVFLTQQIERRALEDAERLAQAIAVARIAPQVLDRDLDGMDRKRLDAVDRLLQPDRLAEFGVERVKIFNAEPRIVYSDDRAKIGQSAASSDLVREALNGRVGSKLTHGVDHSGKGTRMLEVFVPLIDDQASRPHGVFEVYLPYAPVADAVAHDTRNLYAALAVGFIVLWLGLFRVVANASKSLRHQASENRRHAREDSLTQLPNRRSLQEAIQESLHQAGPGRLAALLLIDLDHFKEVNDTLGHDHGDLLLQKVAARLRGRMRSTDVLARLGGDEFAVFLADAPDRDVVRSRAAELLGALREPVALSRLSVVVDASIGISICPEHGTTLETLLKHADVAMYAAKNTAEGVREYAPEMDPYTYERLELGAQLHGAIDRGELVVHYQPLVAASDGRVTGAEALVRWQHPERGLIPPGEFLPLAERTGAIGPLTEFVIDSAVRDARAWQRQGLDLRMSVNLASASAGDMHLPEMVADALKRHGLRPERLVLELSEDTVITDPRRVGEVLLRLHSLGVRLALDDFGTGMSSLAHLRRLPLQQLKIDRGFVSGLLGDEQDRGVVDAILALATSLNLETVAEGVEDAATAAALSKRGCDQLQGFHFTRPLPKDDFERWVRERRTEVARAPLPLAAA